MACWKMDHFAVIFLARNLHEVRVFSTAMFDDTRGYVQDMSIAIPSGYVKIINSLLEMSIDTVEFPC